MDSVNKNYQVIVSDGATQMLLSHVRFLAQVSDVAALRLIEAFQEKTNSLKQFPDRNPCLNDQMLAVGKYRKLILEKRYLLVYQIKENIVYVDAVVDTRQDYGWLL